MLEITNQGSFINVWFQSLLQDISSHQRIVDSVVEKAQGVLQSSSNPDVANFITEVSSRYETLAEAAKVSWTLVILSFTN